MSIRLQTSLVRRDGAYEAGDIIAMPPAEEARMIESGYATAAESEPVETAELTPEHETTDKQKRRKPRQTRNKNK